MINTLYFGKVYLVVTTKDHAPDIISIECHNDGPAITITVDKQSFLLAANGISNIAVPSGFVQVLVPIGPSVYRFPTEKVSFK